MITIQHRALYNSLRMNWHADPTMRIQPWQVEDYRALPLEALFERLRKKTIILDRTSFVALAEGVDSPEELCECLWADEVLDNTAKDQIYLLVFELWRRIVNEKPCLSIFCDELDYQIFAYDHGKMTHPEAIQDAIANLEMILDENTDAGGDPVEVFEMVSNCCANDLETFLYDFIAEQIDNQNYPYAADLLESFGHYVKGTAWFEFLRARLLAPTDSEGSDAIFRQLTQDIKKQQDLDLGLEVLSFLAKGGDPELFRTLARQTVPMLETEEDFQELLAICADYYHFLDQDQEEQLIKQILRDRPQNELESQIQLKDTKVKEFLKIIK
jgi:hypothetical protein